MNGHHDQTPPGSAGSREEARIETQIHRRRKAKALSPLEPEWDISQPSPPSQLRMSSSPKRSPDSDSLEPPQENQRIMDQSVPDEAIGKPKN